MATPCCPKCSSTNFSSSKNLQAKAVLIYCAKCGAVVGTVPLTKASTGATGGKGGTTSMDDWETQI
jgi:hypothetical protein